MTSEESNLCSEVEDRMAEILDGSAPDHLLDHLADCDRCRDARHDAERARELVAASPGDYEPPADLESRILAALDAAQAEKKPEARATASRDTEPMPAAKPEAPKGPEATPDAPAPPTAQP